MAILTTEEWITLNVDMDWLDAELTAAGYSYTRTGETNRKPVFSGTVDWSAIGTIAAAYDDTFTPLSYFGDNADVRLERKDADEVQLVPIRQGYVEIAGEAIQVEATLTLETDAATSFIITGTNYVQKSTALSTYTGTGSDGNAYNARGLFWIYLTNNHACWNFASYDRRKNLIVSPNAPVSSGAYEGYLSATGYGRYARAVGAISLNSSRQTDSALEVASLFNGRSIDRTQQGETVGNYTNLVIDTDTTIFSGYAVLLAGHEFDLSGCARLRNNDQDECQFKWTIKWGSTEKARCAVNSSNDDFGAQHPASLRATEVVTSAQVVNYKFDLLATAAGSSPAYEAYHSSLVAVRRPEGGS